MVQDNTIVYNTVNHNTIQHNIISHNIIQHDIIQCITQHHTRTTQDSTVQCNTAYIIIT